VRDTSLRAAGQGGRETIVRERHASVQDTAEHETAEHEMAGLTIGQAFEDGEHTVVRVVGIDPEMHFVETEGDDGALLVDDIEHFTATHSPTEPEARR